MHTYTQVVWTKSQQMCIPRSQAETGLLLSLFQLKVPTGRGPAAPPRCRRPPLTHGPLLSCQPALSRPARPCPPAQPRLVQGRYGYISHAIDPGRISSCQVVMRERRSMSRDCICLPAYRDGRLAASCPRSTHYMHRKVSATSASGHVTLSNTSHKIFVMI